MTSPATAGELLAAAAAHLGDARRQKPPRRMPEVALTATGVAAVMTALLRLLRDADVAAAFARTAERRGQASRPARWDARAVRNDDLSHLDGWPAAIARACAILEDSISSLLRPAATVHRRAGREGPGVQLAAAARALTATRDLLHTHFTTGPDGRPAYTSEWAPVIASSPVRRAIASDAAVAARHLSAIAAWAAQSAAQGRSPRRDYATAASRLREASEACWTVEGLIRDAHAADPVRAADAALLHGIPVHQVSPRALPEPGMTPAQLCEGLAATAERVRQATWRELPWWSPATTTASLRQTAASAVVISHCCEITLAGLAGCDAALGGLAGPGGGLPASAVDAIRAAAAAAAPARRQWLEAARGWAGQIVTDSSGLISAVSAETADLALWAGRLAHADPRWTPRHGRDTTPRPPGELARTRRGLARALAAVHGAGETLGRLAESEAVQVRAAAAAGRLYMPARDLPPTQRPAYRYGPAPTGRVRAITGAYTAAGTSSTLLATALDEAARAAGAPPSLLAMARDAARRPEHALGPAAARIWQAGIADAGPVAEIN